MGNLNFQILARYLEGSCSKKDKWSVQRWMQQDSKNKRLLDEYKELWEKARVNSTPGEELFEPVEGWQQLKEQIEFNNSRSKNKQSPKDAYLETKKYSIRYSILRVAAIFIAAAFIGYFAYQMAQNYDAPSNQEPILQKITTKNGQRSRLTLTEGTHILLNAGSKITLPKVFKNDKREVFLEGQAFFKVAEDPNKPFIIHLNGTTVRVLGTEFSIRAYPEDQTVQVVVKKGRVWFSAKKSTESESTILTAGELAEYNEKNSKLITHQVKDLNLYLGWIEGSLNFRNTRMSDVAVDLERRYGVKVTFGNETIKSMKLTAHLKSKRIKNVLDVIAMSLNIKYELNNNHVTFYQR